MDFNNYEAYEYSDIELEKEEQLPTFTTPQTQKLRDEYPEIEQLESGDIGAWLQERKEQLWEKATELELGCNAAKSISLGVAAVGTICYATSPFAPIGAAVAGIAYAWTLFEDTNHTKKFAPVPFIKGNFLEFLNAMGDAGARDEYFSSQNSDAETLLHLNKPEQKEYLFLYESFEKVTNYLENTEPGKRFYAYRWLLGAYSKFRALPTTQSYKNHLNQVAIAIDVDYDRVNQLHERRANTQLPPQVQKQLNNYWQGKEIDICTGEYVDAPRPQEQQARLQPKQEDKRGFGFRKAQKPPQEVTQKPVTAKFTPVDNTPDLPTELAKSLKLSLIVGTPGSGKGMFVTNALDAVKNGKRPVTIFYVDPKNDPKENGYFDGRVDRLYRLDAMSASPEEVFEWVCECLTDYENFDCGTGIKLIVFDELKLVMSILAGVKGGVRWLTTKLSGYSSSGESRGIVFWGISQSAHTKAGFDGSDRAMFIPVFIIDARNIAASEGLLASRMIPSDKRISSDEIKRLCAKSPVGRAIFYGGTNKWYPMPELENFSGFDRDSREFIGNNNPTKIQPKTTIQHLEDSFKGDASNTPRRKKKIDFNTPEWIDFFNDDGSDEEETSLSTTAQEILDYIAQNEPVSKVALKKWCNRNGINLEIRNPAIQELIEAELITLEEEAFRLAGHGGT